MLCGLWNIESAQSEGGFCSRDVFIASVHTLVWTSPMPRSDVVHVVPEMKGTCYSSSYSHTCVSRLRRRLGSAIPSLQAQTRRLQ
jgi:hypothetical protein